MKIEYSKHGGQRIKFRGISKRDIKEVLDNPNKVKKSYRNRYIYSKRLESRYIEVVIVNEAGKMVVITAYYL